ncbi:MAG TPA: hypothetical protein VMZ51_03540 [Acidimicrobiales bacterium]|nr:hypothetical protein [Acidimicrobiales bacterium]
MLRRRVRDSRPAAIFAEDLLQGCSELFTTFGEEPLKLQISIPIDERGVVLLRPHGPLEAPRVPAWMSVTRAAGGCYGIRISRADAGAMIIPGLGEAPMNELTFLVTSHGLEIGPMEVSVDEATARALATALLITVGMKLTKARAQGDLGRQEGERA